MRNEPLDFVQFSYSMSEREAEKELLPVAAERGIATMINRPFQRGELLKRSKGKPLPEPAHELGCESWGQFYLKFILGHPAVTCVIPATSKARHMADNMAANVGRLPNADQRTEMLRLFDAIQA
ncbi:MAG: aryl-alcohol dehydrogenase-like predicted oxidoreductase [Halioglobus sp.]|jgi:aryl-alcohol dehydrogenase-like predicted oxidoreductase